MFNIKQFRYGIVISSLSSIDVINPGIVELVIATVAAESNGGTYLTQINGPALGIIQIEEPTFKDVWNYILKRPELLNKVMLSCNFKNYPTFSELLYNLRFCVIICAINYMRFPTFKPPNPNSVKDLWSVYKEKWNTKLGDTTFDEFVTKYVKFTGIKLSA